MDSLPRPSRPGWLLPMADPEYAYAWYNLGVLYDLYLQDLPAALDHYTSVTSSVTGNAADEDAARSDRWIADLERRIGTPARAAQAREAAMNFVNLFPDSWRPAFAMVFMSMSVLAEDPPKSSPSRSKAKTVSTGQARSGVPPR